MKSGSWYATFAQAFFLLPFFFFLSARKRLLFYQNCERAGLLSSGGLGSSLKENEKNVFENMVWTKSWHGHTKVTQHFRSYNLLCKLLLKQNKVSLGNHRYGILGSKGGKKACFMEYGVDEDLAGSFEDCRKLSKATAFCASYC